MADQGVSSELRSPEAGSAELLPPELVALYVEAVDWLESVLALPEVEDNWDEESALVEYAVGGLCVHAVEGGVGRLEDLLARPEPPGAHLVGVTEFYGPNRVEDPEEPDVLFATLRARAAENAGDGRAPVLAACRSGRDALAQSLPITPAARAVPVVRIPGAAATLEDYLPTRVLEVVLHGDDIVASVPGLSARVAPPPPAAVRCCTELCLELARGRVGDLGALRAFTRAERSEPDALRVL